MLPPQSHPRGRKGGPRRRRAVLGRCRNHTLGRRKPRGGAPPRRPGLRLAFRAGDEWAGIDAGGGLQLGLHPAGPRTPAAGQPGAITVGLSVDEPIERVVSVLEGRGVTFRGPVVDDGGRLKLAFFTDPDGNELYLAEQLRRPGA
jgi:hypothetical protein